MFYLCAQKTAMKKYKVTLSEEEISQLERISRKGSHKSQVTTQVLQKMLGNKKIFTFAPWKQ
jgi:hypothetical protein